MEAVHFVAMILAAWRLTILATQDQISVPWRKARCPQLFRRPRKPKPGTQPKPPKFCFWACPMCMSFWTALVAIAIWRIWPWANLPLAISMLDIMNAGIGVRLGRR